MKKDIKYTDKSKYYFCHSIRVFHFLKCNSFYYIYKEKNLHNDRYYWVFEKTEELNEALKVFQKEKEAFLANNK